MLTPVWENNSSLWNTVCAPAQLQGVAVLRLKRWSNTSTLQYTIDTGILNAVFQYSSKLLLEYWMQTFVFSLGAIPQCTTESVRLLLRCYVSWLVLDFYVIYFPCWTPCIHPSSLFLPFLLCLLLPFSLFPKSSFLLHWKMEARSDHSLAFSVRVFTLQEKVRAEACVDTHKEVILEVTEVHSFTSNKVFCMHWHWLL